MRQSGNAGNAEAEASSQSLYCPRGMRDFVISTGVKAGKRTAMSAKSMGEAKKRASSP